MTKGTSNCLSFLFISTSSIPLSILVLNHFPKLGLFWILRLIAQDELSWFGQLMSPTNQIIPKRDLDVDLRLNKNLN